MNTLSIIHDYLKNNVRAGSLCVDATAGKGRDTALLCSLCGNSGKVIAFDIQKEALSQTEELLNSEGYFAKLILDSHSNMLNYVGENTADCVVFNLGRLPGGDDSIFTTEDTTLPAIDASLKAVKPGGMVIIALYYGGKNGYSEKDAVLKYISELDNRSFSVFCGSWPNRPNDPPIPIFIKKENYGK